MTEPANTYMSLTFGNVPRDKAEKIRAAAEEAAGDIDFSVSYGPPIGELTFDELSEDIPADPVVPDVPTSHAAPEEEPPAPAQ